MTPSTFTPAPPPKPNNTPFSWLRLTASLSIVARYTFTIWRGAVRLPTDTVFGRSATECLQAQPNYSLRLQTYRPQPIKRLHWYFGLTQSNSVAQRYPDQLQSRLYILLFLPRHSRRSQLRHILQAPARFERLSRSQSPISRRSALLFFHAP